MCARPRQTSDEQILAAAARAIGRVGPAKLTLAHVASELGIAPATLVQRFGSKRGLLLALARAGASDEAADACFAMTPGSRDDASPLAGIDGYVTAMAGMARTPQELANHLLFLHTDLTDPDFHDLALAQAMAVQRRLATLLEAAIARRELRPGADAARLARAIQSMVGGSLLAWAILRKGTAVRQLREDVETLVSPYRTKLRSITRPRRARRPPPSNKT
jgi:AcrR family transcriptional regulator